MIQDLGSVTKRTTALRTLGQLIRSTGAVVTPYLQYKYLLSDILGELSMGDGAGKYLSEGARMERHANGAHVLIVIVIFIS